jgi:hypothetical protein
MMEELGRAINYASKLFKKIGRTCSTNLFMLAVASSGLAKSRLSMMVRKNCFDLLKKSSFSVKSRTNIKKSKEN